MWLQKPVPHVLNASKAGAVLSHPKDAAAANVAVRTTGEAGQQNGSKEKGLSELKRPRSRFEESQTEYVKIVTAAKKHRPLTEHQKEVAALQRLGAVPPLTYNADSPTLLSPGPLNTCSIAADNEAEQAIYSSLSLMHSPGCPRQVCYCRYSE